MARNLQEVLAFLLEMFDAQFEIILWYGAFSAFAYHLKRPQNALHAQFV